MNIILMHTIQIDASPHQIRKLKKGHRVRVKRGEGFELLVHPQTYNIVQRAFNKSKGSEIQLSPEEIAMNSGITKAVSPESHITRAGTTTAPPSRSVVQPTVAPAPMAGGGISAGQQLQESLNQLLGSNYGYLKRAGLDNALNSQLSAGMAKHGIDARYNLAPTQAALGLLGPHSRMAGGMLEKSTVGLKGSMMSSYMPPALVSQPFSANFQFQHFLPPQYQHFNSGGHDVMGGNGLYV
jgi:hypothetical protein